MNIALRIDGRAPRRWHADLLRRLAERGHAVRLDDRPGAGGLDANARRLLLVERLVKRHRPTLSRPLAPGALAALASGGAGPVDLAIDLCGEAPAGGAAAWRLLFDGLPGEAALFGAALDGRAPVAALRDAAGARIATARLGTEAGGTLGARLDEHLSGTVGLILAALDGAASRALPPIAGEAAPAGRSGALSARDLARRAARLAAGTAARRIYDACYDGPRWRTGWRRLDGPDLFALRAHPEGGWRVLPDDGRRFYADPFPIVRGGRVTLFVEEFPYGLGRGVISAVPFGPEGPLGTPEVVLDAGHHLSYPFVFEADGDAWMIPESCSVGRVDLYRATAFPGGWTHEATLVDGPAVSDATIHRRADGWWMFGCVREGEGSFSDRLHLWRAPDFRGPWTAHPANPVLVDIASARPAGRMVERDGALLRPVQDCRGGYGAALGIARVTRLDGAGFDQAVETILRPGPLWPGRRLHTLNSAGGLEFIDGSGSTPWSRPDRLARRLLGR